MTVSSRAVGWTIASAPEPCLGPTTDRCIGYQRCKASIRLAGECIFKEKGLCLDPEWARSYNRRLFLAR